MPEAKSSAARWLEVRIVLPAEAAERLAEVALDHGALSATLEDADAGTPDETPQFGEPGEAPATLWRRSVVALLFDSDAPWSEHLAAMAHAAQVTLPDERELVPIAETDWVRQTQNQFPPIAVADGALWIVPTWHDPPATTAPVIRLDPGLAFGTGSHPTTHLCLEWLVREVTAGASVLDYGCGSGILAIAAAKLGAGAVTAVDIDADARTATRANAEANGVPLTVLPADAPLSQTFDLVVANILTRPLIVLAPTLAARVAPHGKMALAGILAEQADAVIAAYAPWIRLAIAAERDGWIRLEGTRL
ncbi:50S ribosomal protein L11 methyltransferase [Hydrogenophilus thiooxidans]|uniref:50S ribosomal protein L11 methyltransferase n=1 Tax=Hydrogenophilus thiooxidans TaxID=2820326 RepID=UPI001C21F862|nr:50S ribosomal protein L11 methyltransferase [Hydrogenophilus thiooxidans]